LKTLAPDRRNTVVFAGYQAAGTRGARMVAGESSIRIHGQDIPVRAEVMSLEGISAHADARQIVQWLATAQRAPRRVYLTHGEPGPADTLRQRIERELGWNAYAPGSGRRSRSNRDRPASRYGRRALVGRLASSEPRHRYARRACRLHAPRLPRLPRRGLHCTGTRR